MTSNDDARKAAEEYVKNAKLCLSIPWRECDFVEIIADAITQDRARRDSKSSAFKQTEKLANFIMAEIPGEPSQDQGAVDTAIRLLKDARRDSLEDMLVKLAGTCPRAKGSLSLCFNLWDKKWCLNYPHPKRVVNTNTSYYARSPTEAARAALGELAAREAGLQILKEHGNELTPQVKAKLDELKGKETV